MTLIEIETALDGAPEFNAGAVGVLVTTLGEDDPMVLAGRRILASLEAIPKGSVLVTEASLATAIHRAYPARRNTESASALTAATILAALKTS
ncbi:MAG: hypothetical protein ACHQ3P_10115 [Candidatus Limnocylindrales bacterium]